MKITSLLAIALSVMLFLSVVSNSVDDIFSKLEQPRNEEPEIEEEGKVRSREPSQKVPSIASLPAKSPKFEKFRMPVSTMAHLKDSGWIDMAKKAFAKEDKKLTKQSVGAIFPYAYAVTITSALNNLFNSDTSILPQNEQSVSFCPGQSASSDIVVGGSNDFRGITTFSNSFSGWYVSMDGGSSLFKEGPIPGPVGASMLNPFGDPVIDRDSNCNFFYAGLGIDDSFFMNAILLARSTSDLTSTSTVTGGEWSPIAIIHETADDFPGGFNDKPWIAVDRSGGSFDGSVYASWTFFKNADFTSRILFARCTNDLSSCTVLRDENNPLSGAATDTQFSYVTVGPDGKVYVAWAEFSGANYNLKLRVSGPGGTSFGPIRNIKTVSDPLFGMPDLNLNFFRIFTQPKIAVDPTGKVYAVWDQCKLSKRILFLGFSFECFDADVMLRTSADMGTTWGTTKRIGTGTTGTHQIFPTVAFDDSTGILTIAYYSSQTDKIGGKHQGQRFHLFQVASSDMGSTFTTVRITPLIMDMGSDWLLFDLFIGDYIQIVADHGRSYIHYTGTTEIKQNSPQQDNIIQRSTITP